MFPEVKSFQGKFVTGCQRKEGIVNRSRSFAKTSCLNAELRLSLLDHRYLFDSCLFFSFLSPLAAD